MATFDDTTARRVVAMTKKVESSKLFDQPTANNAGIIPASFFAKITGKSGSNYSWIAVAPTGSNSWVEHGEWGSGSTSSNYARELNGAAVSTGTIVTMMPATNHDYFVFKHTPGSSTSQPGTTSPLPCCTQSAASKGNAVVLSCATTRSLQKYTIYVPTLNILRTSPTDPFGVPYSLVELVHVSGCVWESDTQYYTDGDIYYWELGVGGSRDPWDSTLELKHGSGIGSGAASGSVGTPRIPSLVYGNPYYYDALGGTIFSLLTDRSTLPANVATWMPCQICVVPKTTPYTTTCIQNVATAKGRTADWPGTMYVDVVGDFSIDKHYVLTGGASIGFANVVQTCPYATSTNTGWFTAQAADGEPVLNAGLYWHAVCWIDDTANGVTHIFFQGDIGIQCCGDNSLNWAFYLNAGGRVNPTTGATEGALGTGYGIQGSGNVVVSDWDNINFSVTLPIKRYTSPTQTTIGYVTATFGE